MERRLCRMGTDPSIGRVGLNKSLCSAESLMINRGSGALSLRPVFRAPFDNLKARGRRSSEERCPIRARSTVEQRKEVQVCPK